MPQLPQFFRTGAKVLIVEDSLFNRTLLAQMVGEMGFQVFLAENGREGVEKVEELHPDIVLMDIEMPVMGGIEAASAIKNLEGIPYTPVMFVSSGIELDELRAAFEAGGDDYLQRPFPYELLEAKIIAHLRTADLYRQVAYFSESRAREEEVAEALFSNAVEFGNLSDPNVRVFKRPADTFSGDVQLTARRPNGDINIILGDFTGHGLMASVGALPLSETFRTMTAKGFEGAHILRQINKKMFSLLPTNMFLALTMVNLTTEGQATVWNAGLPDVYLFKAGRLVRRVASSHPPLGILKDLEDVPSERFQLDAEHHLLLVSDGVLEAINARDELFGEDAMLQAIEGMSDHSDMIGSVIFAVEQFMGGVKQTDDISLISIVNHFSHPDTELTAPSERRKKVEVSDEETTDFWTWYIELNGKSLTRTDPVAQAISRLTDSEGDRDEWQSVFTILTELFVNSLDHGVLGLDSSIKHNADGFMRYFTEREQRLECLESGCVKIHMKHLHFDQGRRLVLTVSDSGPGFDYEQLEDELGASIPLLSGRGIKLVNSLCEKVDYSDGGRTVRIEYVY